MRAIALSTTEFIGCLILVTLLVFVALLLIGQHLSIRMMVESADERRKACLMAHALLSSPLLCKSNPRLERALWSVSKLEQLDFEVLLAQLSFPKYSYELKVVELQSGKEWQYGSAGVLKATCTLPLALSDGKLVRPALLEVKLYG